LELDIRIQQAQEFIIQEGQMADACFGVLHDGPEAPASMGGELQQPDPGMFLRGSQNDLFRAIG
jgi:hypothetical protein